MNFKGGGRMVSAPTRARGLRISALTEGGEFGAEQAKSFVAGALV
ncbi:MAG: hypothetical protein RSA41_07495 [Christensenella sp.]